MRIRRARQQSHHRSSRITSIPCAEVYGLLRALPGVHDLLVTVVCGSSSANLAPAQGCQDHTTSPSAPAALVARADRVHRIPRPTLVTIAKRPSCGGGTAQHIT